MTWKKKGNYHCNAAVILKAFESQVHMEEFPRGKKKQKTLQL